MKTLLMTTRAVIVTLAVFVFTTYTANATPSLMKNSGSVPAQPATPYSLSLSLTEGWNITSTGLPRATVTFANSSSHTVAFFLTSAFSQFTVEYKSVKDDKEAKDDAASRTGWQMLRPIHKTFPSNTSPGKPVDTDTFNILMKLIPKQKDKTDYEVSGFPMSEVGFYRITAFTKIPNVSELDGPASSPTIVRTFTLDLRSNSIIVRRTGTGFVEVPPAASKQVPSK